MLSSILIVAVSLVLLVYWFRYSCLLLLRARAEMLDSAAPLPDPRFAFTTLREPPREAAGLDALEVSLNRDYRILTYLLEHAAGRSLNNIEDRMLVLDYRIMRWWFRLTRVAAPTQAREALSEMAMVLRVLVDKLGPQPDLPSQA